ncbi:B12-binding domain-containing radical SAM protein [Caloranaerobacter azorensis]|uniref:Radical SAM protein n=1 Tax=Caloranaerobacter azorensis TaxID=116090 RepID=A0A6P1YCP5_9FIRM|nr:radical SAM protein [Caloranaerobacter azorensis]QIB26837.1 radical SAM protein [Caloranaerobacter azorensis]
MKKKQHIITKNSTYNINKNSRIICFYTMCNSYHNIILLAKYLKKKREDLIILLGGPQASLTAKLTLETFPWIDIIGIGEGETIIEPLIKALSKQSSISHIQGIAYRENGKVICNPKPNLIKDLDELPFIDYDLVNIEDYDEYVALDVGRGCPYECIYCSTKTFWNRRYRLKSINRIIDEIKHLKNKYNRNKFNFVHDSFVSSKLKILKFCEKILDEGLMIKWTCSARIDNLDEEVIIAMKKAGCTEIFLGIETGSTKLQKDIKKNLKLSRVW